MVEYLMEQYSWIMYVAGGLLGVLALYKMYVKLTPSKKDDKRLNKMLGNYWVKKGLSILKKMSPVGGKVIDQVAEVIDLPDKAIEKVTEKVEEKAEEIAEKAKGALEDALGLTKVLRIPAKDSEKEETGKSEESSE